MNALCNDLQAEVRELAALCETLTPPQWLQSGPFHGWSAWDEIAHLRLFDEAALLALTDPARFADEARRINQEVAQGTRFRTLAHNAYGTLPGPALLAGWRVASEAVVAALRPLDPKARLPWFGPTMSARSFATARLMETWAHGQDIWDLVRRPRPSSARLGHIAHLGVSTRGWTFANRGLPVPEAEPFVALTGPDGSRWTWGDPASSDGVRGPALDFCLVVTQRRHWTDTALQCSDGPARQWLEMAQCFAGPPAQGPTPGSRKIAP